MTGRYYVSNTIVNLSIYCRWIQAKFIPNKPNPRGVELFVTTEAGTGYMLKAMINTNQEFLPRKCAECRDLLETFPDMGYYDAVTVHSICHEGKDEGS